jgi:proteasome lid subunit RPN8/RPN11
MAKAAKVKVRVTTQPVVVMEAEVARQIRQHARTSMKAEVCGVLIGSTEHERMTVEACIQGINAAQGGAHVTFTQDTWEHIYKIKDKEYPDQKIVGWYHSHPGFGVFLSEHDLFIQENFFSNPQQVAWVFDPHTDEEGCFGWVGSKIEKLTGIRIGYSQTIDPGAAAAGANDYEDEDAALNSAIKVGAPRAQEEPPWVRWASMSLGYLVAVMLGLVGGYYFGMRQGVRQAAADMAPELELVKGVQVCRQEQWQPPACQDLLLNLVPQLQAPASPAPQTGPSALQQPSPAPQTGPPALQQPSPAPQTGTPAQQQPSPAPKVLVGPTPVPGKATQTPQQEKSPAPKGNNGKH